MVTKSILFPSVIESNSVELNNVSKDILTGLRIYEDNTSYIIGELALTEGSTPLRAINGSPAYIDYRILFKAGILLATSFSNTYYPKIVVTGFPYATYQSNREDTINLYKGIHNITYDPSTFNPNQSIKPVKIVVHDIIVIPEIQACVTAVRELEKGIKGKFFLCSLGFGSFDACLANENGIIQRTAISNYGLRYAVNLFSKELAKNFYLDLRSEHQLDRAFMDGYIIMNRRKYNITELRKNVLERYYKDIISPSIRNTWKDDDFSKTNYLILAGGGSMYEDLVKCFKDEFKDLLDIVVVDDPLSFASRGYYYYGYKNLNLQSNLLIGLDIGNAHTVLTFEEVAEQPKFIKSEPEYKMKEIVDSTGKHFSKIIFDDSSTFPKE